MIYFVVPEVHNRLVREYLELWGRDVASRFEIVHTETLPTRRRFSPGTYVLAAVDQYSPGMAALVSSVHAALAGRDGVRFLNHPARTLQRFELLDVLHRSGRNEFRAVRVTDDWRSLRFPVFIRDAGTHDGAVKRMCSGRPAAAVRMASNPGNPATLAISCGSVTTAPVPCGITARANSGIQSSELSV